jgi:hypothetical protein
MNAKEEILKMMKQQLKSCEMYCDWKLHSEIEALIAATEAAIFDVPSEEEIEKQIIHQYDYWVIGFKDGINFILNYKKPEHDGK